jgi:hypothetical protein
MKKLIIFGLFGLLSCGPESSEEKHYDYSVVNNSGVTVEIIPYVNGMKEVNNKVTLQNGEIFNKKYTDHAPYSGGLSMRNIFISNTIGLFTHFEFVFKNSKKVIYEECSEIFNCNSQSRNIFNASFNDEQTEIYTITPDDYQNAVDCGGNCN